ncbi:arsenical pump-driving ATPase [Bacillus shivajii]|uniref:arsenical pump-driving ATPase n=1 Tax=Bacillus shivajii TaxID=1983719 RepID=UPI001CFA98CD|nr:arsenical pump-driving ATPase [Bacillus shivajii]UCZ52396.1 arsenical pump-driving ATPase [Bacillus shivajii]
MERLTPEYISGTKHIFFTGKGGVGKTSTACATAVAIANKGKKVLLVSTDPASNLQDVFETTIKSHPTEIEGVPNLYAVNLDPEEAARAYKDKMIEPYRGKLPEAALKSMEEQLSGACTVEVAAFDEFTNLLGDTKTTDEFDHILFDTAPTGHTLRLLQLPSAWNNFLEENTHGASCLGPLSGLGEKKDLYEKTVGTLANKEETTLVLVSRPEYGSLDEARRASKELQQLGMTNQQMIVNGVFERNSEDKLAKALEKKQLDALDYQKKWLNDFPLYYLPLVPYNLTGLESLEMIFDDEKNRKRNSFDEPNGLSYDLPPINSLIDQYAEKTNGVIMTMGKGGVGKTTMAAVIAIGLAEKGHRVHLTTTDPAAHLQHVLKNQESLNNITLSNIDPKAEVERYKREVLERLDEDLSQEEIDYVKEDLESPCTEEIAVFQAFAKVVERSKEEFVVVDTAPTGHTLLLLDATQSYHLEVERSSGDLPESVRNLLPRLRDSNETHVVLVTLPEATPVFEAERLQEDLKRAHIEPQWWIINQSFSATNTDDPVLRGRANAEQRWIEKVTNHLGENTVLVPWSEKEVIGLEMLKSMI